MAVAVAAAAAEATGPAWKAWLPWLFLTGFVFVWGMNPVKAQLNAWFAPQIPVPALHLAVQKMPPVAPVPTREPTIFNLNLLSATGTDNVSGVTNAYHLQDADGLVVLPLQAATHLDGLAHVGREDTLFNGYWSGTVSARGGATRLGSDLLAGGLVGRCVLVDAARHTELDPFRGVIDVADLELRMDPGGETVPGRIGAVRPAGHRGPARVLRKAGLPPGGARRNSQGS